MSLDHQRNCIIKIVVVGNANAGKTSIIKRYCYNEMTKNYKATIGTDFAVKTITINNVTVMIQFWDIAGQERFGTMTNHYYRDAHGALIVFDMTDPASFQGVVKWRDDIDRKMQPTPNVPTLVLANKNDMKGKCPTIPDNEISELVSRYENFIGWKNTSAITQENIHESVALLIEKILEKPGSLYPGNDKGVDLNSSKSAEEEDSRCCAGQ